MNIIDIVKNAPEGAERYKVFDKEGHTEYYAIINGVKSFYNPIGDSWVACFVSHYDLSLPLPKLKTEWVKVEDSIFHPQLQVDFESGDLYRLAADGTYKDINADELTLMTNLVGGYLYRKVEKVTDEKQEFEAKFNKIAKEHFNSGTEESWTDYLYNRGCRFPELD